MAPRRRSPFLAVLVGLLALALSTLAPVPVGAQTDPGATFGGTDAAAITTTTVAAGSPTTAVSATTAAEAGQTLVETAKPPERRLATESRRVMAIIGALVFVALALLVLTIRYWRVTKPVRFEPDASTPTPEPEVPATPAAAAAAVAEPAASAEDVPTGRSTRRSRRSVAGADHAAADADWEPRGTGEHAVVEPAPTGAARPGRTARKVALTRSADR